MHVRPRGRGGGSPMITKPTGSPASRPFDSQLRSFQLACMSPIPLLEPDAAPWAKLKARLNDETHRYVQVQQRFAADIERPSLEKELGFAVNIFINYNGNAPLTTGLVRSLEANATPFHFAILSVTSWKNLVMY
jgi:hypothetical protein